MLKDYELLDRAEILFPDREEIADLRRVLIDGDWASLFRLLQNQDPLDAISNEEAQIDFFESRDVIEDLRKVVMENNLHSLFRLVERPSLRKILLNEDLRTLYKWLIALTDSSLLKGLYSLFAKEEDFETDCMSRGQIRSKVWLVEELKKLDLELGTVYLLGGWYATLGPLFKDHQLKIEKLRSFDVDPKCTPIAGRMNKDWEMQDWKFKATTFDIHDLNYELATYTTVNSKGETATLNEVPNTLINTSCEHIENFDDWFKKIPQGRLLILQSNDYFDNDQHVNCVKNLEDFKNKVPLSEILYEGELDLGLYKRFMLIGYK